MTKGIKDKIDLALQFHQSGGFEKAEQLYREILKEYPDNADTLNLLGLLKLQNKEFNDAVFYIQKALELSPCAYFYDSLGRAHLANGDYFRAIECFKIVLKCSPEDFDACFNLAMTYKNNQQFDEAIQIYQSALSLNPDSADVYFNLANIFESKDDTVQALKYYKESVEHNIENSHVNYFLAVSYLKLKDFKNGWDYYEYRPSKEFGILTQALSHDLASKPLWMGEEMLDKTLFVYYEAAFGDSLMYARYLPLLAKMFKKVLFKPQYNLVDLFKNSDLGVEILDGCSKDFDFDVHIPLMSVPYVLQHNLEEQIPFKEGYLKSNSKRVDAYREKYFNNDKFKIGIKWCGNPAYDTNRIVPLEAFCKLFDLPSTQFYSLQKGPGEEDLEKLPKDYNVIDLAPTFNDFEDTAAAIDNLDLVICNDTSVAHLAGALGKSCWVLLPYVANWRWHNDFSYSPWYKDIKLFKQTTPDDWSSVFENVLSELK